MRDRPPHLRSPAVSRPMGMSRKAALTRLNGLLPRVREHLDKLKADPDNWAANHWRWEIGGWLRQMSDVLGAVGEKTADDWRAIIDVCQTELGEDRDE